MGKQFSNVSGRYGAPMGRYSAPDLDTTRGTVRLFKVRLDSGGYDDGGAYWGLGERLWCAIDRDGNMQFTRAPTREHAAMLLKIPAPALIRPFDWRAHIAAILDGRRPAPPGMDEAGIQAYGHLCHVVEAEKED